MDALAGAIAGSVFGLISGAVASMFALKRLRVERFTEREKRFEIAQGGYRQCYRKFLVNVSACHSGRKGFPLEGQEKTDVTTLLDNFWEASFTGDPVVISELERYWPAEARGRGELPDQTLPDSLLEAMRLHGIRSLKDQDKAREGFQAAA